MNICPNCRKEIGAAFNVTGKGIPKEGDIAVCSGCEVFVVFNNSGSWGIMTPGMYQHMKTYEPMVFGYLQNALNTIIEEKKRARQIN